MGQSTARGVFKVKLKIAPQYQHQGALLVYTFVLIPPYASSIIFFKARAFFNGRVVALFAGAVVGSKG
jgi:hypothetical protein